ncbi:NAD(P)H-binding protein [Aquihabitans sp. G128]|uniref:NAD(P)H-binding protein n=1 Tax=Aquihabitans sp. G128 TaxID=2849779 RepID=UPI001C22999F|nr:NAD(P)H-binding protein [Aquihabitans sp. G128]QXC62187.1 NAD(P)H-binding protein [Aquihabitans sp. G128]
MLVTILGAHGAIARHLTRSLAAVGDQVRGVVRNPDHHADLVADGAEPRVCDLETADDAAIDAALAGSDVVVFAAGAGPGSGAARKEALDRDGAIRAADSAVRLGIARFLVVSAMGTDDPPADDEVFSVYLRAKADADAAVRRAGLDHTIVRPGGLTDDPPTGHVALARHVAPGSVPRADVAAVLAALVHDPASAGRTVELVGGDVPIAEAVAALAGSVEPDRG